MATICSAVDTPFTPAATPFYVQVTGGTAVLQSRGNGSAAWAGGEVMGNAAQGTQRAIIPNPVAAVDYQFVTVTGTPVVLATQ
jgi:hypothetical protein